MSALSVPHCKAICNNVKFPAFVWPIFRPVDSLFAEHNQIRPHLHFVYFSNKIKIFCSHGAERCSSAEEIQK
jgi:hypothetical protein